MMIITGGCLLYNDQPGAIWVSKQYLWSINITWMMCNISITALMYEILTKRLFISKIEAGRDSIQTQIIVFSISVDFKLTRGNTFLRILGSWWWADEISNNQWLQVATCQQIVDLHITTSSHHQYKTTQTWTTKWHYTYTGDSYWIFWIMWSGHFHKLAP